jgi:inhibitor of cysteine peptidase
MQPIRLRRIDSALGIFLFLLPILLLAIAFAPHAAFAATKVVTDADKGGEIHMKAGDQLELRLRANPSTGYMWYLQAKSTPLLKLTGQSQTEATEPGVGRPVFQIFKFEPRRSGDGVLLMHYVRSWEKPAPDDEQFDVHVFIE